MFIFQLMGGLGNQMFQYAAARSLSLKRNIPFKTDFDDPYQFVKRRYSLGIFNINVEQASKYELRKCKPKRRWQKRWWMLMGKNPANKLYKERKDFQFDKDLFACPDGSYVSGFWQSEKYFEDIEEIIRSDFQILKTASTVNLEWLSNINSCNAVSVHVRRGDYVAVQKTNQLHGTCDTGYYETAIKKINEIIKDPVFFFFSDDMDWVKANIKTDHTSCYVDINDDEHNYEDLRLMSACKHHIIANSSFSWWGAWLNPRKGKTVIAPKKWMNDPSLQTTDLIPLSWLTV